MKKYFSLFKYEVKTIIRDPMNIFMLSFPLIVFVLGAFVFPTVFDTMAADEEALMVVLLLLIIVILTFGNYFIAAMATFLLLDHKDECTLNTIAVTPVGAAGYLRFKMTYVYIFSLITTLLVLVGVKYIAGAKYAIYGMSLFDNVGIGKIIVFSAVSSLFVPALALFQSAFARNKVEGFAYVKGAGIVAFIPILMVLDAMQGGMQYILGIFPNFWAVKGMLSAFMPMKASSADLNFALYMAIGAVFNLLIIGVTYRMFIKKTQY